MIPKSKYKAIKVNDETINLLKEYQQTKFKNNQGHSKLTIDNILEIRTLLGIISQDEIAERFGVSKYVISRIKRGVSFSYIN